MAIVYPLTFPATKGLCSFTVRALDVVGMQDSPIALSQTLYDWGGDRLEADCEAVVMGRADAEYWTTFLLALRGQLGTFLMGDTVGATPRGAWAGTPLLNGIHAAGARTLTVDGLTAATTGKAGDWIQFGSGSTTRLHKVLLDFTANGSGQATIEIYPRLRAQLADNTALVKTSTKGLWRLASNAREWNIELAQHYGPLRFSCVEAIEV